MQVIDPRESPNRSLTMNGGAGGPAFDLLDRNGDGVLTRGEFEGSTSPQSPESPLDESLAFLDMASENYGSPHLQALHQP